MIGIGCDIVKLSRIEKLMEKEGHVRILTDEERILYDALPNQRRCEWLAGRFAAKEAVIKAMAREKAYVLSEVAILYEGKQPSCHIPGYLLHVSIAHEEDYAIAYAIAEKE